VLIHLWPFLRDMQRGLYYADSFFAPWASWIPDLPKPVYFALLSLCVLSALLMSLGLWTRLSVGYTACFVTYNFYLSETHFRHNRNFMVLVLVILALLPCGKMLSWDRWRQRRAEREKAQPKPAEEGVVRDPRQHDVRASLWPMYLFRFEVVCVYLASSSSKLVNPDWWHGTVNWDRVLWFKDQIERSGVPESIVSVITTQGFHSVFAKVAIFTEMFIALGLLFTRSRYAAIWVGIAFHLTIGISLRVQIFSYLAIAALLIWITPRVGERRLVVDLNTDAGRRFATWIRRLDWLGRFRIEASTPGVAVPPIRLVDKDGREFTGRAAVWRSLLRCPAVFPWIAPLMLVSLWRPAPSARAPATTSA